MAETKEPKGGQSFKAPEWKNDFTPGSTEAEMSRFRGTGWQSKLPDIRMEQPPPGGEDADAAQKRMFEEMGMDRAFGRESSFGRFIEVLRDLKGLEGEGRDRALERIESIYQEVISEQIDEIAELQQYEFRLHNPYPYDSRWGLEYFKNVQKQLNKTLRSAVREVEGRGGQEPEARRYRGYDSESVAWLRRLKRDFIWAESTFRVLEGLGPSMDFYYDGELQLKTLRSIHSKITADDLEGVFSAKLAGEVGSVAKEGEGIRELATRYQDDNAFWRIAIATVAQWDYNNPPAEYRGPSEEEEDKRKKRNEPRKVLRSMHLRPEEIDFIQQVFGEGLHIKYKDRTGMVHKIPQTILNFYSSSSSSEMMEKYRVRLEALLAIGAREALGNVKDKSDQDKRTTISSLLKRVEDYEKERMGARSSPEMRGLESRLAESVVKSGILLDWGLMSAGELGWHWKYEIIKVAELSVTKIEELKARGYRILKLGDAKAQLEGSEDPNIEVFLTRTSEIGGIYGAFDVQTVMYWARHITDYDANSETRSSLLPPTTGEWRRHWPDNPPYWLPDMHSREDDVLQQVLEIIKGDGGRHFRNQEAIRTGPSGPIYFGDLHPAVESFMNQTQWFFVTPFYNEHRSRDYLMTFPVFFPTDFNYLNFWRNIAVAEKAGRSAKTIDSLSAWEELLARRRSMSGFDWSHIGTHAADWYHVNLDQTQRWLGFMANPHQFSQPAKAEFDQFFENPSTTSVKQLAKRIRLGTRGVHLPKGVLEVCMIPFLITLSTVNKHHIMDRKTWLKPADVNAWEDETMEWINAALNLPGSKGLDVDSIAPYGNSLALMIFAYATLIRRYAVAASDQMGEEVKETARFVKGKWSSMLKSRLNP